MYKTKVVYRIVFSNDGPGGGGGVASFAHPREYTFGNNDIILNSKTSDKLKRNANILEKVNRKFAIFFTRQP